MDVELKALTLWEQAERIESAWNMRFRSSVEQHDALIGYSYACGVYDDFLIVCKPDGEYYRCDYTIAADGAITFVDPDAWVKVEREFVAKSLPINDETLVMHGDEIKALGGGKIGGYLVVFSDEQSPDLEGDFFDASTDFGFDGDETKVGVYYHHGMDVKVGKRRIGQGVVKKTDIGLWIEAQLAMRDEYERAIYELAEKGKLGWSSGAPAHLVERTAVGKSYHLKTWVLAEGSPTPAPAEPRTKAVPIKSLVMTDVFKSDTQQSQPETLPETLASVADVDTATQDTSITTQVPKVEITMSDEQNGRVASASNESGAPSELEALKSRMDAMGTNISAVLKIMEDSPAIKGAGYYTETGGASDKTIKSFGDWLLAVQRGDSVRLKSLYGSTKDMSSDTGALGGYTVPVEYGTQLMQVAAQESPIVNRVRRIPVSAPKGNYPALDQYVAPTAGSGNTALAGRMTTAKRAEGGSYTETQPQFTEISYSINDAVSGYVEVTKELRADSAIAIEAFLQTVIGVAVSSKLEYYILRGNGVGEPLGILNAPSLVSVTVATNNTFAYGDAVNMITRFKALGGQPVWLHHPSIYADIAAFTVASGSPVVWAADLAGAQRQMLLGYPLIQSEHLPQANNSGNTILADLGAYLLFTKGDLYIEFSEHAAFTSGKDTWRFGQRVDGQPWLKSAITLADPQGSFTQSAFVKSDD